MGTQRQQAFIDQSPHPKTKKMASPKQAIEEAWTRANTLASETEGWKEEKKVPVVSKNVRANVLLSGFIFAPAGEGKSTLTRIIHVDPAGNIPSSVVNVTAKATHEVISSFNKLLQ